MSPTMAATENIIFDSFGRGPDRFFERYMNEHCGEWVFNNTQVQSAVSRFCGHYCAFMYSS